MDLRINKRVDLYFLRSTRVMFLQTIFSTDYYYFFFVYKKIAVVIVEGVDLCK